MRGGWFYAPDGATTRAFGEGLLAGRIPIVGGGLLGRQEATMSMLHADDAGRAFADAVGGDATGTFHLVDDEPVTLATFLRAFADRLDAPSPRRVPAWLARFFVGKHAVRFLSRSMPTTNERFCETSGWEPRYSTYREGLTRVVGWWQDDGIVRETANGLEWVGE